MTLGNYARLTCHVVAIQAIRRGLVSTPPSHMIGDERDNLRVNAWIRGGKKNGIFVRPRLFMPYYEEIKVTITFLGNPKLFCSVWREYFFNDEHLFRVCYRL